MSHEGIFTALDADRLRPFLAAPPAGEPPRTTLRRCLEGCRVEEWAPGIQWGPLLTGDQEIGQDRLDDPQRECWERLVRALFDTPASVPWLEAALDGRLHGLVGPPELAALVGELRETGVLAALDGFEREENPELEEQFGYAAVGAFLERAAARGCWVLARE